MATILENPTLPSERSQFFGSQLANTTEFTDQELVLEYGKTSNIKLCELKIFISATHICGVQAACLISDSSSNIIGTKHVAPNPGETIKECCFTIEGDEFINEIVGRYLKTGVTFLEFRTTSGRMFSFGYKKRKSFSKSCVPDQQFLILKGGFGKENIHHVGFLAAPLPIFTNISFFRVLSEIVSAGAEEMQPEVLVAEMETIHNVNQRKLQRIIGTQERAATV